MGSLSIAHWLIVLLAIGVPLLIILLLVGMLKRQPGELRNTFKFRTAVHLVLAFLTSGLVLTIPLFLWLAYRSYCDGEAPGHSGALTSPAKPSKAEELERLHALKVSGALTQAEYDEEKRKLLSP